MTVSDLPAVNATLNGTATVLLTLGFILIKQRQIALHRACMLTAFGVSCLFLITYITYHYLRHGLHTPLGTDGPILTFYKVMLFSHITLAIVIVPLILITLRHAFAGRYETHRAWARWTFPLWYYVSVTGVLVYFFLYQWFPHK